MHRGDVPSRAFSEADRRGLFRYLHDPTRLRRNALAARFFADQSVDATGFEADERGLLAVRQAIVASAERLRQADLQKGLRAQGERYFQVIVRCDVQGELNKIVASDLGISVRHLRRLRRVAQERIARALWVAQEPASVSLDIAVLELAIARQLWEGAQCRSALDMLSSIASRASEARYRVRAIVDLIDLLVQQAKLETAEKALCDACAVLSWSDVSCTDKGVYGSWIDFAASRIAFARGNVREGADQQEAAISRMAENGAGGDLLGRELFARALLERAGRKHLWGSFNLALADLDQIAQLQAEKAPFPVDLLTYYSILVGEITIAVSGFDSVCCASLKRALAIAQAHGLGRGTIAAAYVLSYMQYLGGEVSEAEDLARANVTAAVELGMADLIVEVALDAAELALLRRDREKGQLYLGLAQKNANGGTPAVRLEVDQAACLLLLGKPAESLRRAASAERAASTLANERLRGTALRAMAQAQYALGARTDAFRTVHQMLSTLELHGSRPSFAMGLRVAAQITGRAEYAGRATELLR